MIAPKSFTKILIRVRGFDMHDTNFLIESKIKIIQVNSVLENKGTIHATITTKQFDRITIKPYTFTLFDWAEIIERGWIE